MYGKPTKLDQAAQHACIFSCAHIHVESSFPSVWRVLSRHNTRYFFGFVCLWFVVWCDVVVVVCCVLAPQRHVVV